MAFDAFNKEKLDVNSSLNDLEASIRKSNSEYNNKTNEINTLEVEITKLNMNLDNLLNRLGEEYSLTYEGAKNTALNAGIILHKYSIFLDSNYQFYLCNL